MRASDSAILLSARAAAAEVAGDVIDADTAERHSPAAFFSTAPFQFDSPADVERMPKMSKMCTRHYL